MARISTKTKNVDDLQSIPGVGPRIAAGLRDIGVRCVADLDGADPQALYDRMCRHQGERIDRCLLYVLRCAVYFASTQRPDPDRLKWWNWKDAVGNASQVSRKRPRSLT